MPLLREPSEPKLPKLLAYMQGVEGAWSASAQVPGSTELGGGQWPGRGLRVWAAETHAVTPSRAVGLALGVHQFPIRHTGGAWQPCFSSPDNLFPPKPDTGLPAGGSDVEAENL
jgi:hypothetical protein